MSDRRDKKSEIVKFRAPLRLKQDFMARARMEGRPASDIFREMMEAYLRRPLQSTATPRLETAMTAIRNHPRRAGFAAILGAAGVSALLAGALPAGAAPDLRPAFESMDRNGDGAVDADEFRDMNIQITADSMNVMDVARNRPAWAIYAGAPRLTAAPAAQWEAVSPAGSRSRAEQFATLDLDGDAQVSLEEWEAHFFEAMERAFRALDANGDGAITSDERGLTALDSNGDGRISHSEFSAALVYQF